jgi:16S rRNA (cytosine967-C5)-methyltransferase
MACPSSPPSASAAGVTPARRVAFEVVRRTFEHDAWTDRAFRSAADRHGLAGRDRAFAQRLAFGAVERRGTTDRFAEDLTDRPLARLDAPVLAALRLGLYEIVISDGAGHAAVGEAVELAKGAAPGPRRRAAAGLVNAVLRRAVRERESLRAELDDSTAERAAVCHSYPAWIARRLWDELGAEAARSVMAAMNHAPERSLRVNRLRTCRDAVLAQLRTARESAAPARAAEPLLAPPDGIVAPGAWGPVLRAMIERGEVVPQARASQAVVAVLAPEPGERILDLCAAPGIKATAIAAGVRDEGEVRSIERDPGRASQLAELADRLGARAVRPEVGDAAEADLGAGYDRVLVDPPCTDLGALGSRPDARWRKTAEMAAGLAELQGRILARAARALRPGGTLVYSTCTISRAENEDVVTRALAGDEGLVADDMGASHGAIASPHDPRFLQTRPDRDGTDGFFIARLRRADG